MKKRRRMVILGVVLAAALAAGGLWYGRTVDVYTLTEGAEIDLISVLLLRNTPGVMEMEQRSLRLERGDADFDETLAQVEGLRFHRPPTNWLLLAVPALGNLGSQTKHAPETAYFDFYLSLAQAGQETWSAELTFWVDGWSYRDFQRYVSLPLAESGGKEAGQALGAALWALAEESEV